MDRAAGGSKNTDNTKVRSNEQKRVPMIKSCLQRFELSDWHQRLRPLFGVDLEQRAPAKPSRVCSGRLSSHFLSLFLCCSDVELRCVNSSAQFWPRVAFDCPEISRFPPDQSTAATTQPARHSPTLTLTQTLAQSLTHSLTHLEARKQVRQPVTQCVRLSIFVKFRSIQILQTNLATNVDELSRISTT